MKTIGIIFLLFSGFFYSYSQVSLTGGTYSQNFNTLSSSGSSSTVVTGWTFNETGTGANTSYIAGTGSSSTGDTYSLGASSNAERALGGLQSGSLTPTLGASFTNNSGATITELAIQYVGEQWRLGATGRNDKLDFQYSLNATSLTTGTWTDVNALDFTAPVSSGATGALDGNAAANRATISATIAALNIVDGATFWIRWNSFDASGSDDALGIDDFSLTPTIPSCTPVSEPSTNTSAITISEGCTSAQLNFTNGNGARRMIIMSVNCTISLPSDFSTYTANNTFGNGSTTGTGDYVVYDGTAATTIVDGLTSGTSYCFMIVEYNGSGACTNYLTSGVGTNSFTTSSSCSTPQIRSILVNACTAQEGMDEVVVLNTGSSALDVNNMRISFPNGGDFCNSGCGSQTLVNNASYISDLNDLAGCSLFQYATTIPANSTLVVFTGASPTLVFDYSSECPGGGPYYVIFCNNTDVTGRFANNAGATRNLSVNFGTSSDAVSYMSNSANTNDDGDYVSFDNDGNATYGNTSTCNSPILLPLSYSYIKAQGLTNEVLLNWGTLEERNLSYFEVQQFNSINGEFESVGKLDAHGNSSELLHYQFNLKNLKAGKYYFRLMQSDFDGIQTYSEIVSADVISDKLQIVSISYSKLMIELTQELAVNSQLRFYDIAGKLIQENKLEEKTAVIPFPDITNQMLYLYIQQEGKSEIFKIYLTK